MIDEDVLILKGHEEISLLQGREIDLIGVVRAAYETHAQGESALPHSTFLRFPAEPRNRIIALPAFLGGPFEVAGIKWVASFPGNHDLGLDRASAVVILNSLHTGRPRAILEGSVISAKRTAASAALAAQCLSGERGVTSVGMIGCGLINFEIARFLLAVWPEIRTCLLFDTDVARAQQFERKCRSLSETIRVIVATDIETVLRDSPLVSMATTTLQPHIFDLSECPSGSTILHISLRDLSPQVILASDNIVDDIDHACRAQTSIHLTEQQVGHRNFIRCTLGDILTGADDARKDDNGVAVFSPFGLGILDIAVGQFVFDLAVKENRGIVIDSFLPDPWTQRAESQELVGV
jgi:ornithine cyclodeaminase